SWSGPFLAQREAARQDLAKPDESQKRRQANDHSYNATEHGLSDPVWISLHSTLAYTKRRGDVPEQQRNLNASLSSWPAPTGYAAGPAHRPFAGPRSPS